MNYSVITISGEVASGKSSIARELLFLLSDWQRLNTGQRFRDFCESRGMTIQQVSHLSDAVHQKFDAYQVSLIRSGSRLVIEGRMAGWLARDLPYAFRVFCYAPLAVRVERYLLRHNGSREQAVEEIHYRDSRDVQKFRDIYNVEDYRNPKYYHLLLDTSHQRPRDLAGVILSKAKIATIIQPD